MVSRIPKSIQEKVILKWLQGKTRDEIAKECKISGGSVTNIIQSLRSKDREFDLWRVIALQMRERKITIDSLALFIRLRELIKTEYVDCGIHAAESDKRIDSLVEALIVFCFNKQMTVPEFGNQVHRLNRIADELGISLVWLPDYARLLALDITTRRKEIRRLEVKEERFRKHYQVRREVINDIISNGPYMFAAYQTIKARLREVENERNEYQLELQYAKMEIRALEIEAERKATGSTSYSPQNKTLVH